MTRDALRCAAGPPMPLSWSPNCGPPSLRAPHSNGRSFLGSAAVRQIEDMFDHPQVLGEDLVATLDHPLIGRYRAMKAPIKFSGTPGPAPTPAPTFGQHSDEILTGCGYSAEEIAALRQRGVVL